MTQSWISGHSCALPLPHLVVEARQPVLNRRTRGLQFSTKVLVLVRYRNPQTPSKIFYSFHSFHGWIFPGTKRSELDKLADIWCVWRWGRGVIPITLVQSGWLAYLEVTLWVNFGSYSGCVFELRSLHQTLACLHCFKTCNSTYWHICQLTHNKFRSWKWGSICILAYTLRDVPSLWCHLHAWLLMA